MDELIDLIYSKECLYNPAFLSEQKSVNRITGMLLSKQKQMTGIYQKPSKNSKRINSYL